MVIAKFKSFGGLPFRTYTKLYENTVWSTINYGAAIWGCKQHTCINTVQLRAARFFLGVGRYTPNAGVLGDIGWEPSLAKQWKTVTSHWARLQLMDESRLNAKINKWSESKSGRNCKNWNFRIKRLFEEANYDEEFVRNNIRHLKHHVFSFEFEKFKRNWLHDVNRENARNGLGKNKLRLYRRFKDEYETENHVKCLMPRGHRSAYSKFRCGVAPIRIETGRYERLPVEERKCFHCQTAIEDEEHVLLTCPLYNDIRQEYFDNVSSNGIDIQQKTLSEQLEYILSCVDDKTIRLSAKVCFNILKRRRCEFYS